MRTETQRDGYIVVAPRIFFTPEVVAHYALARHESFPDDDVRLHGVAEDGAMVCWCGEEHSLRDFARCWLAIVVQYEANGIASVFDDETVVVSVQQRGMSVDAAIAVELAELTPTSVADVVDNLSMALCATLICYGFEDLVALLRRRRRFGLLVGNDIHALASAVSELGARELHIAYRFDGETLLRAIHDQALVLIGGADPDANVVFGCHLNLRTQISVLYEMRGALV